MGKRVKKPGVRGPNKSNRRKKTYSHHRERMWKQRMRDCYYCDLRLTLERNKPNSMTLDHKMPLSRGGLDKPRNHVPACARCNQAKGNLLEYEFRRKLDDGTAFDLGEKAKRQAAEFREAMDRAREERLAR